MWMAHRNTKALHIADINEWPTIVIACFDQAATMNDVSIIVFPDSDTSGPVGWIDSLE